MRRTIGVLGRRGLAVIPLEMPALSPTMTHGGVAMWHKKVGDAIAPGDALMDIETDKAVLPLEAQDDAFLAHIIVPDNTANIACGTLLGYLVDEESEIESLKDQFVNRPTSTDAPKTEAPVVESPVGVDPIPSSSREPSIQFRYGVRDVVDKTETVANAAPSPPKADKPASVVSTSPTSQPEVTSAVSKDSREERTFTDIPHSQMRRIIASRLLESKKTIPHFYVTEDNCALDEVLSLRKTLKALPDGMGVVSVNDFIIKACALALNDIPEINSRWDSASQSVVVNPQVDISVAVATPGGLITPIVTSADKRGIKQISECVKDLAERAKSNHLAPHEFQGGSFTYVY